jgi:hypothetical protein
MIFRYLCCGTGSGSGDCPDQPIVIQQDSGVVINPGNQTVIVSPQEIDMIVDIGTVNIVIECED